LYADRAYIAIMSALFDHMLVDEYQDTNALQASILLAMKSDSAGADGCRRQYAGYLGVPRRGFIGSFFDRPLDP
jgi:superfamily I DNA/RNA helicase